MIHKLLDKYKSFPVQIRASIWFFICSFLQKGISVLTTPIFTRLFTTVEYGQYSVFNSWLGIVTVFVSLNLSAGVFATGLVKYEEDRAKFISSMQGLSVALTLCWTIVYLFTQEFWNEIFELTTTQILAMLVMIWTTNVFNFWAAEQRVKFNYKLLVSLTMVVSIVRPCIEILFVIQAENKVLARILGWILVELLAYSGLFILHIYKGKKLCDIKYWKYALTFNVPLVPHYLSQTVLTSSDRIMITNMIGESEAGIYSLAYSISLLMTLFNTALLSTISPWIYQKIKAKQIQEIGNVSYIALSIIAVANLILIAFAPEAVAIFAPAEYMDAIWVIPPIAMSVFFMFEYDLFAKFQFYYERTNYIMLASVFGAIINIILNIIFIPILGYYAAGYTTLVCYILYVAAHYFFMRRVCCEYLDDIKVFELKKIVSITSSFLLIGFLLMFTYHFALLRYLVVVMLVIILLANRNMILREIRLLLDVRERK